MGSCLVLDSTCGGVRARSQWIEVLFYPAGCSGCLMRSQSVLTSLNLSQCLGLWTELRGISEKPAFAKLIFQTAVSSYLFVGLCSFSYLMFHIFPFLSDGGMPSHRASRNYFHNCIGRWLSKRQEGCTSATLCTIPSSSATLPLSCLSLVSYYTHDFLQLSWQLLPCHLFS